MAANVDDKFYGQLTLAVGSDDSIGTEEAYIDTLGLPGGLTLRAGRFFSNLGYFNSHHTHTDHFIDRPLVRSEEHTSELQSLMRISYAVFCLKKKINTK